MVTGLCAIARWLESFIISSPLTNRHDCWMEQNTVASVRACSLQSDLNNFFLIFFKNSLRTWGPHTGVYGTPPKLDGFRFGSVNRPPHRVLSTKWSPELGGPWNKLITASRHWKRQKPPPATSTTTAGNTPGPLGTLLSPPPFRSSIGTVGDLGLRVPIGFTVASRSTLPASSLCLEEVSLESGLHRNGMACYLGQDFACQSD